jgi:nitrogen-specific signal transduction histidine kinase
MHLSAALIAVAVFASILAILLLRRRGADLDAREPETQRDANRIVLHQLKNPLQSILLHADLLGDPVAAGSEESRAELRNAILHEARRIAALIERLEHRNGDRRQEFDLESRPPAIPSSR